MSMSASTNRLRTSTDERESTGQATRTVEAETAAMPEVPTTCRIARTPARKKAKELAKYLRGERPDYICMKELFRHLREELEIRVPRQQHKLPYVPTEEEIQRYYQVVWESENLQDAILIKLLLVTGVRVGELVKIQLADVDLGQCQIRINDGKGGKDRRVPFPATFREALGLHIQALRQKNAVYLFESSWKRPYSERGVRKILARL